MCARVYVSIGSNIEREQSIEAALRQLQTDYGDLEQSSIYESDAVGFDSAPFYNLVVAFDTDKSARAVQTHLHDIEAASGRVRGGAMAARTLDLDLLLYDDLVIDEYRLKLPRNDIERYAFVLGPLAEIAGSKKHPVTGRRYADMWAEFDDTQQQLTRVDWPAPAADT
ncbi:MAG: 2-amino-4-hydroxy-6-hydroxymethyldihydropteridine diphosphokinase [Gammaproteobacteria bacterium]